MTRRRKPAHPPVPTFNQRCHERGPETPIEVFRDYGLIRITAAKSVRFPAMPPR